MNSKLPANWSMVIGGKDTQPIVLHPSIPAADLKKTSEFLAITSGIRRFLLTGDMSVVVAGDVSLSLQEEVCCYMDQLATEGFDIRGVFADETRQTMTHLIVSGSDHHEYTAGQERIPTVIAELEGRQRRGKGTKIGRVSHLSFNYQR